MVPLENALSVLLILNLVRKSTHSIESGLRNQEHVNIYNLLDDFVKKCDEEEQRATSYMNGATAKNLVTILKKSR